MRNSYSPAFAAVASPASGFWPSAARAATINTNPANPAHHRLNMNSPSGNLPHSTPSNQDCSSGNLGILRNKKPDSPPVHVRRASWDSYLWLSTLKSCPQDVEITQEAEEFFPRWPSC